MSNTNISMTAVHLIIGAVRESIAYAALANINGGESELNRELAEFAPKVERVYQSLKDNHDFGHWQYDVVENFGASCIDRIYTGSIDEAHFRALVTYAQAATVRQISAAEIETARHAWNGTPSPFAETYASAWISTAHVTPRTLDGLNALRDSEVLPFWISATLYGYIVRFDALATYDLAEDETNTIVKRLATCDDMRAIAALLDAHGLQAAHLDADGPIIPGLQTFGH